MPRHYNDVRTPAIQTRAIKNEDLNSSLTPLHMRVILPHLLQAAIEDKNKQDSS
jgi:hypothetical protein